MRQCGILASCVAVTAMCCCYTYLFLSFTKLVVPRPEMRFVNRTSFKLCTAVDPGYWGLLNCFRRTINATESALIVQTLRALTDALDSANISYHMYGGTLIGSWRHHGLVPWDDDVDIRVPWSKHEQVSAVLKNLSADYVLRERRNPMAWKFFARVGTVPFPKHDHSFPFVDIFFYEETTSHIHDAQWRNGYRVNRSDVFPLRRRPWEDLMLYAPAHPAEYLEQCGAPNATTSCTSPYYSHRRESSLGSGITVECSRLWTCFPFVFRESTPDQTTETLKVSDYTAASVVLPYAITN